MAAESTVLLPDQDEMAEKKPRYRSVKIEESIITKASIIAEAMSQGSKKRITVAELLSDLLRDQVAKKYPAALKRLEEIDG